jgi:circadian clock protein KaiC
MIEKVPSGIKGLDEIMGGGLPKGRTALVTGGPGTGKTMLALEFLVRGASEFGEPGVFISFEETEDELIANGASLGFDLPGLRDRGLFTMDFVRVERAEIEETGEYDLEGLFIRLDYAVSSIGAKRVVLDTIESLFSGMANTSILRGELRRLFRWLKDRGLTAIVTGERGNNTLMREGLEEYVSDCVIFLDHRVNEQISTRRLRVVKYRGSKHGTNEYPFLMSDQGFMVLPVTSVELNYEASTERISSGIPHLDQMLGEKGYYRRSFILVTGTAGTGKTSLASTFTEAACRRGERTVYFAFEESPDQIMRNMASIGVNLKLYRDAGLLLFSAERPTFYGLEHHLLKMINTVEAFNPSVVVVDPFSNLPEVGSPREVRSMMQRLVDIFKKRGITMLFTSLTTGGENPETTDVGISSLSDTWILLKSIETGGERNMALYVLKSRGMEHSNQVREFRITDKGLDIFNVYVGPEGVLTGSARIIQEAREKEREEALRQEISRLEKNLEERRGIMESRIGQIRSEFEYEKNELANRIDEKNISLKSIARMRKEMSESRGGGSSGDGGRPKRQGRAKRPS